MLAKPNYVNTCVTSARVSFALQQLSRYPAWAIDIESTGLDWFEDKIVGLGVCGFVPESWERGDTFYFPFRHLYGGNLDIDVLRTLLMLMRTKSVYGFNLYGFDLHLIWEEAGIHEFESFNDAIIWSFLVNENEPRGGYRQAALCAKYLGSQWIEHEIGMEKELEASLLRGEKGRMNQLDPRSVADYCCGDVDSVYGLTRFYHNHATRMGVDHLLEPVSLYGQLVALMCHEGVPIDEFRLQEVWERARSEIATLVGESIAEGIPGDLFRNPKKAAGILGTEDTAEETLERERSDDPRVHALLRYRKLQRACGSYYEPLMRDVRQGRYHPEISLTGTVTGRPAFWGGRGHMNVLAIPRDTKLYKVKHLIRAPKGQKILQADYRGAEMRMATHYARELRMAELLRSGQNIHSVTAADMNASYQDAKTLNFSVIYGIGEKTLAQQLNIPIRKAAQYLNRYHSLYPGFRRFLANADRTAVRNGFVRLWTGRRRNYNGGWRTPTHKASDHIVQGGVGELLRTKQTQLHQELSDVKQTLQVYDSAIMLVPDDEDPNKICGDVREIMRDDQWLVPMEVDTGLGQSLAELEEYA